MENLPRNTNMKPVHLALLVVVLILGVVNLLLGLGLIGGSSGSSAVGGQWEYRVVPFQEMDSIGFKAVAAELGIKEDAEGKMQLPQSKVVKHILLQTTLTELQKEGWESLYVTADNHYVFRRAK